MEEINFYESESVNVTQSRFVVGSKTFAMRNISSVQLGIIKANRGFWIVLIILGLALLLPEETRVFGLVVAIIAGLVLYTLKDQYTVQITTNAGTVNGLTSKDYHYIQEIVNALNEAIIHRG